MKSESSGFEPMFSTTCVNWPSEIPEIFKVISSGSEAVRVMSSILAPAIKRSLVNLESPFGCNFADLILRNRQVGFG